MIASVTRHGTAFLAGVVCVALALAACRTGVPLLDANDGPDVVFGTITGTVSGPDGKTAVSGRRVNAINVETGARESTVTSSTGGYTFKLPAGRYRVEVELATGEALIEGESQFKLSPSELQHDVDLRIGPRREPAASFIYQPPLQSGAPIA